MMSPEPQKNARSLSDLSSSAVPPHAAAPRGSAAEKVRRFWKMTGMTEAEFAEFVNASCRALYDGTEFDPLNGISRDLMLRLLQDYAAAVRKRDAFCGEIVERNLRNFLASGASTEILDDFGNEIYMLARNKELMLSVLLNFIRSVLRNDFVQPRERVRVNLSPGVLNEIWRKAEEHYALEGSPE